MQNSLLALFTTTVTRDFAGDEVLSTIFTLPDARRCLMGRRPR
jgi:hypothetical protein